MSVSIVEATARVQEIGRRYLRGAKVTAAVGPQKLPLRDIWERSFRI